MNTTPLTPPASGAKWKRRKRERPDEIIRAAERLFSENGFSATRMEDIAKSAGIVKGTIYLYFGSKEELFKTIEQAGYASSHIAAHGFF